MICLIGLGLYDEEDLSMRAIEAIKECDSVYVEFYTSKWFGSLGKIEKMTKKKVIELSREKVESDFLINEARTKVVALLVPGDPLAATTHMELIIQAKKEKINTRIIHNASIMISIAETGLWLYKFGRATTLVTPEKNYKPSSPFDIIIANKKNGLHTLVLLDIKENKKYMTITEALKLLQELDRNKILWDEKIVACAKLGSGDQIIKYKKISELIEDDIEETPAILIVPGDMHFKEKEALEMFP